MLIKPKHIRKMYAYFDTLPIISNVNEVSNKLEKCPCKIFGNLNHGH